MTTTHVRVQWPVDRWQQLVDDYAVTGHALLLELLEEALALGGRHHGGDGGDDELRLRGVPEQVAHLMSGSQIKSTLKKDYKSKYQIL